MENFGRVILAMARHGELSHLFHLLRGLRLASYNLLFLQQLAKDYPISIGLCHEACEAMSCQ